MCMDCRYVIRFWLAFQILAPVEILNVAPDARLQVTPQESKNGNNLVIIIITVVAAAFVLVIAAIGWFQKMKVGEESGWRA